MQNNINPDSQWIFSSLDYFMANNKANASLFCSLYERKQILIDMLKQKKIDGKKYKAIVIKMLKDENQVVKKCAESDALQLKDPKSEESINQWFESMINKTGAALEQQEKIYTNLKKSANQPQNKSIMQAQEIKQITIQPKNSQVKRQPVTSNITIKGVNLGEITSFKIIDTFLQDEKDPILFQKLLEKKKLMLDLIAKNALNPEKYHFMIVDSLKNGKSQQLISDLKFQLDGLTDFHDGNKNKWFKQIVDEAKDNLQSQEQQLQDLKKGKKGVNKPEVSKIQQKKEQKEDPFPSEPVNMKQVISFKVIEEQLSQNDDNKTIYKTLLQKKLNLLQLYKKGSLTPQSYKNILTKAISQVKNPAVKESMQMQLQQIKDLHQGNIVLWFKDIISNAELFLQDQKQKLGNLEKGIKPKKVVDSDEEIDVDDLEQEIIIDSDQQVKKAKPTKQIKKDASKQIIQVKPTQKFAQKPAKSNQVKAQILQNLSQVYSLKAIDQYCEQNNKNFEVFCKLFERKKQIIQQISSRKITAEIYKELQVKTLKSSKNEKLRDIVEMELMDLKQMCDDDVNKWFEQLINDSGMLYEDQEALYNAIQQKLASKGASVQPSKQAQGGTIKQNSPPKKVQKPQLSQVACLSAITKLFTIAVNTEDYDYYKDLQKKRGQLIDLIAQQRLTSPKYRAINSKASQTAVEIVKNCINEQVNLLKTQFKGDEKAWFDFLTKKFKQNPPYLKSQQSNQMQIINNSPLHRKIEYFLKKMAKYQSIFYYFKKNKIAYEDNKMISSYQKSMRKQVVNCLQMIRKQSDLDVYKLTNKMFPQITPEGFYGVSINSLKQKAMNYCQLIAKEIAMLKDYASKLKKTTNTENISNVKKQITKCQQNIAYLKKWPINSFTPFPLITEQKVEKYNLDLISKLDENDLQVIITRFQGINGELVMNLYVSNMERQRLTCKAVNGYCNYNCIVKLSVKEKLQISKGDKKIISIKLFKRGFFGGLSILAQENIQASFTRNNIIQQTINIGGINVSYCLKIQKPLRPLTTVISHIELKQYPAYKYSENFQQQLIKKYVMYSSPSQSQIISIDP